MVVKCHPPANPSFSTFQVKSGRVLELAIEILTKIPLVISAILGLDYTGTWFISGFCPIHLGGANA